MPRIACLLPIALVLAAGCGPREGPQGGEALYLRYCASCHGVGGRGDGPAAPALSPPPVDLTRGTWDVPELMELIDGRRAVRAHGTDAMPVWGEVFRDSLLGTPHARRTALLHVQALATRVRALEKGVQP
jgi:mono/diheme cytochrome c family protein